MQLCLYSNKYLPQPATVFILIKLLYLLHLLVKARVLNLRLWRLSVDKRLLFQLWMRMANVLKSHFGWISIPFPISRIDRVFLPRYRHLNAAVILLGQLLLVTHFYPYNLILLMKIQKTKLAKIYIFWHFIRNDHIQIVTRALQSSFNIALYF